MTTQLNQPKHSIFFKSIAGILVFSFLGSSAAFAYDPAQYSKLSMDHELRSRLEMLVRNKVAKMSLKGKDRLIHKIENVYARYEGRFNKMSAEQKQQRSLELMALHERQQRELGEKNSSHPAPAETLDAQAIQSLVSTDEQNSAEQMNAEQKSQFNEWLKSTDASEPSKDSAANSADRDVASSLNHFHLKRDDDDAIADAFTFLLLLLLAVVCVGIIIWIFSAFVGLVVHLLITGLILIGAIWLGCFIFNAIEDSDQPCRKEGSLLA